MKSFKWQLLQWCTCSLQHLSDTENYKSEVLRYLNTRRPSLKPRLIKSCPLPFSPGSWRKRCVKIDQWPAGLESSSSQIGHIGTNGVTVHKKPRIGTHHRSGIGILHSWHFSLSFLTIFPLIWLIYCIALLGCVIVVCVVLTVQYMGLQFYYILQCFYIRIYFSSSFPSFSHNIIIIYFLLSLVVVVSIVVLDILLIIFLF